MLGEIGSISWGTLRAEDLIPAFADELERLDEEGKYSDLIKEANEITDFDSEESSYILNEELFNALNDFAPDGCYFGASEGDGTDFGFWLID